MNTNDDTSVKKAWDDWSDLDVSNKITELKKQCFPDDNDFVTWDDYCHNPKAMWPIIVVNGISIQAPN
jgi:hypothetical protein